MRTAILGLVLFLVAGVAWADEAGLAGWGIAVTPLVDGDAELLGVTEQDVRYAIDKELLRYGLRVEDTAPTSLQVEAFAVCPDKDAMAAYVVDTNFFVYSALVSNSAGVRSGVFRASIWRAQNLGCSGSANDRRAKILSVVGRQVEAFCIDYIKANPGLARNVTLSGPGAQPSVTSALPAKIPDDSEAEEAIVWEETPTHRIKVKYQHGKEVGRWSFPKAKATEETAPRGPQSDADLPAGR